MTSVGKFGRLFVLLFSAMVLLAACDSDEERAEKHFQAGLALLEEGDTARAMVEFRNVFKLDSNHFEARLVAARTHRSIGKIGNAYKGFRRVVEQQPDTLEARIALAEIAISTQDWDEAELHGRAAQELNAQDEQVEIIVIVLDFVEAVRQKDEIALTIQGENALKYLDAHPQNMMARRLVIDWYGRTKNLEALMVIAQDGLVHHPEDFELNTVFLQGQLWKQDFDGASETLKAMTGYFPDNADVRKMLITLYIERDDLDSAEAYLKELAAAPEATQDNKISVVRFLMEARGADVARTEIERLIATEEETTAYRMLLASIQFDAGEQDDAIADLEAMLDKTPAESDAPEEGSAAADEAQENRISAKVLLSQMLVRIGDQVGARSRIEEVLQDDSSSVEALKMRAAWLIEEDKPDEAVADLRAALSETPDDANIMTLMAAAHERAGDANLAGERYALAVELSLQAPDESLRFVRYLVREGRDEAAINVLNDALEKSPNNVALLRSLANLHMRAKSWDGVTRVIWKLKALETDEATALANGFEAEMLLYQERTDDSITLLQGLVDQGGAAQSGAFAALINAKVQAGEVVEATELTVARLQAEPENPSLRYIRAALHVIADERSEAAALYTGLMEEVPGHPVIMRTLQAILVADGRMDEAEAMLEDQIKKAENPTAARLLKAGLLESKKDFDGAIATYEILYEQDSSNIVVANNLASLITTHSNKPEDLDRAFAIARRLRSVEVPALQDTYGWIEYRRGNYTEALKYLEPAAAGLPNHPLIQYHLGMALVAAERNAEARDVLTRTIELAGDNPLPQFVNARDVLEGLAE